MSKQYVTVDGNRRKTKLSAVWTQMKQRCTNPANKRYERYGGRGISVCDEWQDFSAFHEWAVNNGYAEGLSIDRIDNDGNYSPENCRWATPLQQVKNRGNYIMPNHRGSKHRKARLTESDVLEIRELIDGGMLVKSIAAQFGVSASSISHIKNGTTWRHL